PDLFPRRHPIQLRQLRQVDRVAQRIEDRVLDLVIGRRMGGICCWRRLGRCRLEAPGKGSHALQPRGSGRPTGRRAGGCRAGCRRGRPRLALAEPHAPFRLSLPLPASFRLKSDLLAGILRPESTVASSPIVSTALALGLIWMSICPLLVAFMNSGPSNPTTTGLSMPQTRVNSWTLISDRFGMPVWLSTTRGGRSFGRDALSQSTSCL